MDRSLTKMCLARQMLLYRRERLIHRRNAQCVSHIELALLRRTQSPISLRRTFKESLLAVSRVLPGTGAASEAGTGRLQKSLSEASKLPSTVPNVRAGQLSAPPLQIVPQQLPVAQQRPLINPDLLSMQLPLGEPILSARNSTVAADRPAPDESLVRFSALALNLLRPQGAEPDRGTSTHARKESDLAAGCIDIVPRSHIFH